MRRAIFAAVIASSLLLVGCNNPDALTGRTWYLTSGTARLPAFQWNLPLRDAIKYTITFNTDGTYSAKADCNQLAGTYKTTGPRGITITPGLSTMAYCGPESHDTLFVGMLAAAANYTVRLNDLTLETTDGGSLSFTAVTPSSSESPGASATATTAATPTTKPTASPTPKPTEAATATPKPTEAATATPKPTSGATGSPKPTSGATATPKPTEAPTATPKPTATPAPPTAGLTGTAWQLTAVTTVEPPFQGAIDAAQQPLYTITFNTDATFAAKADCNTLAGTYTTPDTTAAAGTLTLTPGPTTLVACADGSLSPLYIDALGRTASYAIANNALTITLLDGGTLQYAVAPTK